MNHRAVAAVVLALSAAAAVAGGNHAKTGAAERQQTAWGIAGSAHQARAIEIAMTDDMRFAPGQIEVRQGETIRFVVRNKGRTLHEIVLGTRDALDGHAALMAKFPGMEHDEPHMTHVKPGARQEIVWNFNRPGEFHYACLIPGHYQAGMVGAIRVTPSAQINERKKT